MPKMKSNRGAVKRLRDHRHWQDSASARQQESHPHEEIDEAEA